MSMSVTATYSGVGVNANDVLIQLLDTPLSPTLAPGKFAIDLLPAYYNWTVVSDVGSVFMEMTIDGINWYGQCAMQDLTATTAQTYVLTTSVGKPAVFYGNVRGIRIKQSGASAATAHLMGWGWGIF